jgi:cell division protein FtsI (penicillin-binding protein 3)
MGIYSTTQGARKVRLAVTFARRRRVILVIAVCVWGAVWARAIQLQLVANDQLRVEAMQQSDRRVTLPAPRGEMVDREGCLLAINVAARSYFAYPQRESSADQLAARFASVRGSSTRSLAGEWRERDNKFTWMVRRCSAEASDQIDRWKIPGVYPTWEYQRIYPHLFPGFAGPIGFVNDTMGGAAGLEDYYNDILRGTDGEGVFVADANGSRFAVDPIAGCRPVAGSRLHLTLDARWQSILGEELMAAVEKWHAKSGMGLFMDPHTGAIIAMVDVDPERPVNAPVLKNRLISDVYEPGSTFKLVAYSGAFSDGVLQLRQYFDGGGGSGTFSGKVIHDDHPCGVLSTEDAYVKSSNVIAARVGNRLEPGRLDFWCRRFGFGEKLGIDLPGESPGRIAQQKNTEFNIAQRSFGHGIAITPLQLAVAYSAVANGGYLVRPHLVSAIESDDGAIRRIPVEGHRIIAPEVALLMKRLMRGVVERGTAKAIYDSVFTFAGKTGTAQKPDPKTKAYSKNKFMASFVGFYPADDPRVLGLVILDEPEPVHYGGLTAAPVLLNTVRRAASDGDVPASDWQEYRHREIDSLNSRPEDWSDRLVAAVAPVIRTSVAHAASTSPSQKSDLDISNETDGVYKGVTGWDRLLSCAQAAKVERELKRSILPDSLRSAPVAAVTPESDPTVVNSGRAPKTGEHVQ